LISAAALLAGCTKTPIPIDPGTQAMVEEAYIYGLPLIMSYKTMYAYCVDKKGPNYKAPFNQLSNVARVYGPQDTTVVSPNSDTPYTLMWMDLRAEPVVITVPAMESNRYYTIQLQDICTYNFGYIGSRTTGNGAGSYLVTGPSWNGDMPEGVRQVFSTNADYAFGVGRTQLFSAEDLDNVQRIQKGYKVQTVSDFLGSKAPPKAPVVAFPAWKPSAVGNDFISYLTFALQHVTPDAAEKQLWDKWASIGVAPGKAYDYSKLAEEKQKAITAGVKSAIAKINDKAARAAIAGNNRAGYGGDWLLRAAVTQMGWGANDAVEASYPAYRSDADGEVLDASKRNYTLTFPKDGLPPVKAFWSVTMYDGKSQLLVDNPLDRYLINSPMLGDMKKNEDGSLTLYIQKESPGKAKEANWLPAANGTFYLILRLYWPTRSILQGSWRMPDVEKVE